MVASTTVVESITDQLSVNPLPVIERQSLEFQWMPFSNNHIFKHEPQMFARAKGVSYFTPTGREIIDGCSGLFTTPLGHGRPEIAEAVYEQLLTLDYTSHFQRGSESSFKLAEKIASMTPEGLNRIFYTNSGSESVETAMKICLAYHHARGDAQRIRFVSRERAYHGVNFGGVALSGMMKNRDVFASQVNSAFHMRHTCLPEHQFTVGQPEQGADLADDLLRIINTHGGHTIAACFVEPIAGSIGGYVPPVGYLDRLRKICDEHGILLVFDEVITGFGRTGQAFASQSFGVTPDIITMAKALTNGAQPMGAVAVKTEVYDSVVSSNDGMGADLFHGYTYSGHPAACAAALATLQIYENDNIFAKARTLSPYFMNKVAQLKDIPVIRDTRCYGMMAGIDLKLDGKPGIRGHNAQVALFDAGLHIKATGDAILLAPPFVMTKSQIDEMFEKFSGVLQKMDV